MSHQRGSQRLWHLLITKENRYKIWILGALEGINYSREPENSVSRLMVSKCLPSLHIMTYWNIWLIYRWNSPQACVLWNLRIERSSGPDRLVRTVSMSKPSFFIICSISSTNTSINMSSTYLRKLNLILVNSMIYYTSVNFFFVKLWPINLNIKMYSIKTTFTIK